MEVVVVYLQGKSPKPQTENEDIHFVSKWKQSYMLHEARRFYPGTAVINFVSMKYTKVCLSMADTKSDHGNPQQA